MQNRVLTVAAALGVLAACTEAVETPLAAPRLSLAADAGLFSHAYPSDIAWPPGSPQRIDGFLNPGDSSVLADMAGLAADRVGAPLTAGLVLAFDAEPDLTGWPTAPAATIGDDSPAWLVDLTTGERIPWVWRWFKEAGPYQPAHTLRVAPELGFGLAGGRPHAFVIRKGRGVERGPAMAALLDGKRPDGALGGRAQTVVREALSALAARGVRAGDLVWLQAFTTEDTTARWRELFNATRDATPTLPLRNLTTTKVLADACLIEGTIPLPQFQAGQPPFFFGDGHFVFDDEGRLVVQNVVDVPLAIVLPPVTMPTEGFPLLHYIHGTSGLSTQVFDRGAVPADSHLPAKDAGPGRLLAARGIASAGSALPINPQRSPSALGYGMYNVLYPRALKDNFRQGVIEQSLFLDALLAARLDPALCPGLDASAAPDGKVFFRADRVAGMGQSLGAIQLGLWGPVEPRIGAVLPSGAGGHYAEMFPTARVIPGDLILRVLALPNPDEILDPLHMIGFLVQMAFEPIDPTAHARRVLREPLAGIPAKHVYAPAGYDDGFFRPGSIRSLMGGLGVELVGESVHPDLAELAERTGRRNPDYPVSLNVETPDGPRSAAVVQFLEDGILDGHHVSFQRDDVKHQYLCWLQSWYDLDAPVVVAPAPLTAPCGY